MKHTHRVQSGCSMMLDKDPETRATVKELLAHKWFKVYCVYELCTFVYV